MPSWYPHSQRLSVLARVVATGNLNNPAAALCQGVLQSRPIRRTEGSPNDDQHTLGEVLRPASNGDVAVHIPGGPKVDYARLDVEVERVAGRLAAAGASPGTTVSIILPNGLEFVVVFLAVARCGAVAAPLNPAYTVDEFKFYMEDASSGSRHSSGRRPPGTRRCGATWRGVHRCFTRRRPPGVDQERPGPDRIVRPRPAIARRSRAVPAHVGHHEQTQGRAALTHANLMSSLANISEHLRTHSCRLVADRHATVSMYMACSERHSALSTRAARWWCRRGSRRAASGPTKKRPAPPGTPPSLPSTRSCSNAPMTTARHAVHSDSSGRALRPSPPPSLGNSRNGSRRRCWKRTE